MRAKTVTAVVAAVATILWAYGLTSLQPLAEAAGTGENNSYWARDMRWAAAMAAVGLLLALTGTDRRARGYVLTGAVSWFAADLALDRAGVTWFLALAAPAALLVATAALVLSRANPATPGPASSATLGPPDAATNGGAGAGPPARSRLLIVVAAVCAACAPITAMLESPTDVEPQLASTRVLAAILLMAAAVAAALAVAPDRSPTRLAAAAMVLAGSAAVLVALGGAGVTTLVAGGPLLAATWALSKPWVGVAQIAGVTVTGVVAYPLMSLILFYGQAFVPIGAPFTALAGSPAVHSADFDALFLATGIGVALIFVGASRLAARLTPTPVLSGN